MSNIQFTGGRNAPNNLSLNAGKDLHDKYGMLKEGYNTRGGEGMVAVGVTHVGGTKGAGKDGMKGYVEEKIVFGPKDTNEPTKPTAPAPEAARPDLTGPTPNVRLSERAAEANAAVEAYEKEYLRKQGDHTIRNDQGAVQEFKDAYQRNLTEELKDKAPDAIADKKSEIALNDIQKATDYDLKLARSGMQPGQAGQRGLDFT